MLKIYPTVRSPNEMHAKTLHCLFPRLEEAPTAEAIKRSTKRYPPLDMEGAFIQRLAAVRVVEIGGQSTAAAAAAAAAAAVAVELRPNWSYRFVLQQRTKNESSTARDGTSLHG